MLIQMYAAAAFQFNQGDAGVLMSGYAFMRSFFLIVIFPRVIYWGRKMYAKRAGSGSDRDPEVITPLPDSPQEFDPPINTETEEEPVIPKPDDERSAGAFDLFFLRWSLLVDGALTTLSAFATQKWHIYLGENQFSVRICYVIMSSNIRQLPTSYLSALVPRQQPKVLSRRCVHLPSEPMPSMLLPSWRILLA
jgi:hypothetical protein